MLMSYTDGEKKVERGFLESLATLSILSFFENLSFCCDKCSIPILNRALPASRVASFLWERKGKGFWIGWFLDCSFLELNEFIRVPYPFLGIFSLNRKLKIHI